MCHRDALIVVVGIFIIGLLIFAHIVGHQPLEYNRYLNKLVAWSYFNGLLTKDSQVYIHQGDSLVMKLNFMN